MNYTAFLQSKQQSGGGEGITDPDLPAFLFDFQRDLVEWALRHGRAAIFADCGLGKGPMALVWADQIARQTNGRVLILTPLAVGAQLAREAEKFGVEATRVRDGKIPPGANLIITNYEQLHRFDPHDFTGAVCDESSILKNFDGKTKAAVTEFLRTLPYRLLCTATAAPNDWIELGTSSEALGHLGHVDMLGRFFVNDQNAVKTNRNWSGSLWRLRGHAVDPFWRWVTSWARALRRPSDLGYDDTRFTLPKLTEREHVVKSRSVREGFLFEVPAVGLFEEREERRRTIPERCEYAAELVNKTKKPAVVWCHLNAEGDLLQRLIPDAVQVSGRDSDESKEAAYEAFGRGESRVLVVKPKIGAWGLNWQHCAHVVTFATHSYEQHYQGVRRCWRFGQTRPVVVDVVATEAEQAIRENLQRKQVQADEMFSRLVTYMSDALRVERGVYGDTPIERPSWL